MLVNFPLPMMTALLCGVVAVLVWRLELGVIRANILFSALFSLCAVEAVLVGLRFGYGVEELTPLQRTLPLFLGPLLYLGFAAMTVGKRDFLKIVMSHLGAAVTVIALFWLLGEDLRHLDWIISASYLFYVIALYQLWRKAPDALTRARVGVTRSLSNWMLRAIGLLVFVLLLDTAIALDFAFNRGINAPTLISYGTVPLIVILLVILITIPRMLARSQTVAHSTPASGPEDTEIEARLRALMKQDLLFLDPDITVQRLAKRLHLPARDLSAAVNRTQGMNVSQYVNEFRLAHAAELLMHNDESVHKIAAQSGFMTRSNFYREFQRVYGQSPTEYRNSGKPEIIAAGPN